MDGDGTSHSTNRTRSRAEEILEQILASKDGRSLTKMSQNTYSEQPILRTGADFARERALRRQEGREAARNAREQRVERRHLLGERPLVPSLRSLHGRRSHL